MSETNNILKSFYYPFNDEEIRLFCEGKSGVYMVRNEITKEDYKGSGQSEKKDANRLYARFRNHFYHSPKSSNKNLKKAIERYGIQNFSFHILEFTSYEEATDREDFHLRTTLPKYNKAPTALSTLGYTHTEESMRKMKENYSLERRLRIGSLNRGKNLPETVKKKLSDKAKIRNKDPIFKEKHRKSVQDVSYKFSKPVKLLNGTTFELITTLPSLKSVEKYYNYEISYRQLKRCVAGKKIVKKLNILIEYI